MLIRTQNGLPTSDAKNSWDLMEDVITVIDEEPNRLNWVEWLVRDVAFFHLSRTQDAKIPACKTIGCIGGWCSALTDSWNSVYPYSCVSDWKNLVYATGPYADPRQDENRSSMQPLPGETQRQYADRAIKAIRLYMTRNEEALRGHELLLPKHLGGTAC